LRKTRACAGVLRNFSFFAPAIPPETSPVDAMIFLIPSLTSLPAEPPRPRMNWKTMIRINGVTAMINIHASGPNGIPIDWKKVEIGLNSSTMDCAKSDQGVCNYFTY
jgi:hypothetical protein